MQRPAVRPGLIGQDKVGTFSVRPIGIGGGGLESLDLGSNRRAGAIFGRQQALNTAEAIQSASMFLGSAEAINTDLDRYMKVTKEDIKRVAQQYLRPDNSTVILIKPPEGPRP